MAGASEYVIDSFLVAVCDNIRIIKSRLLKGKQWGVSNVDEAVFLWRESSGIDHCFGHPGGVLFCTGLRDVQLG